MGKLKSSLRFIVMIFILPGVLNFIVYYGFTTNYTTRVFSENSFSSQYDRSVYKYRILGKYLLLALNKFLESTLDEEKPMSKPQYKIKSFNILSYRIKILDILPYRIKLLDRKGTNIFYNSYFILNTTFLCLTCLVLCLVLNLKVFTITEREKDLLILLQTFFMVITQFVIVPYDTLLYFFLTIGIYSILKEKTKYTFAILLLVIVLATLTKETAALILSFYATIYIHKNGLKPNKDLIKLILLVLAFLATYIVLRIIYGTDNMLYDSINLSNNFTYLTSLLGIFFFLSVLYVIFYNTKNIKSCSLFLLLSSPYIVMVFLSAVTWEVRLWIPLFLPLIILSILNPHATLQETV